MPKIIASSLAEHRDLRRAALVDAAAELAREGGGAAITMAAVAERAGLSRTAVYEYFRSSADLVADLVLDELAIWAHELATAVEGAAETTSLDADADADAHADKQVEAWIRAALDYVADGRHALARAVSDVTLPADRRGEVGAMHRLLVDPLVSPLRTTHGEDAERIALFINGLVDAATRRIERGGQADIEIASTVTFARAGMRATSLQSGRTSRP
jgi:AcrR family transcriptional regulator